MLKNKVYSNTGNDNVVCKIVVPRSLYTPRDFTNADQWYFNGFIIDIEGDLIIVDPGVDFYSRFTSTGYEFSQISTLIVTHNHIDHTASAVIFIEKMMKYKNLNHRIYISQDAWESKIPEYIKDQASSHEYANLVQLLHGDHGVVIKDEQSKYSIEFIALYHSCPDTFGFVLSTPYKNIGYISDTGYAITVKTEHGIENAEATTGEYSGIAEKHSYIADFFKTCNTVVVNINDLDYNRHSKYHLSGWDVLDIFAENSTIENLILQHLSSINAEGEDSNYLYKLFFMDQKYKTIVPHFIGRSINI